MLAPGETGIVGEMGEDASALMPVVTMVGIDLLVVLDEIAVATLAAGVLAGVALAGVAVAPCVLATDVTLSSCCCCTVEMLAVAFAAAN